MPAAAPQPESQEDILDAALAALTDDDIPPDDTAWAVPDPDYDRPSELADLTAAELHELAAPATGEPDGLALVVLAAPVGGGGCTGFAQDGPLDVLAAGMALAGFADEAHARLGALSDDELVGVMRGWRRQTSWAQARELAAIAELARRRPADRTPPPAPGQFPAELSEFTADEVAMALTLTQRGGERQLGLALDLAARPATAAALEAGRIDLYKAGIILDGISLLSDEHAAAVEASVLPGAADQTSGQLRGSVTRAVLRLDPQAARRRREEAQKGARVECWTDPEGTATLAGRWLPPAEVLAADKRLCQVAGYWKKLIRAAWKQADPGEHLPRPEHGTDLLRARAYLALLLGHPLEAPPADLLPPVDAASPGPDGQHVPAGPHGAPGPVGQHVPAGSDAAPSPDGASDPDDPHVPAGPDNTSGQAGQRVPSGLRRPDPAVAVRTGDPVAALPPLAGSIAVTLPLATLLGLSDNPGEVAGYGPLHGDITRDLANAAAGHPATSWTLILTDPDGQAVGYGYAPRARPSRGHPADGWTITLTTQRIARGCHSP